MASNENARNNIPQNDPSKAMDSKREVEQSPDEKIGMDFPGYPHYPAKEDIMSQDSGHHRVDANLEEMAAGSNASGVSQRFGDERGKPVSDAAAEGESDDLAALNSTPDEIGKPHNVSNEDLSQEEQGDQSER